ncbi:hypothetical protein HETIRDRAFT_448582 [Heterobasidion irregulare TC 32-1]|uniref:SRR1-like domain-containing protein n=1 Tax=Heterobasidion irregulare (strain TC 32-1) TaxID=747525 RepID=W4KI12_HETIT|nr:uncharacterized protein HETIRDRAFT_448582 [Heterobasidion irregulare TC 32-1]ETW85498.1 hypothetical protein HETIRDRAFT_448582 [Heterobasidion irregulare TC 32-1]
MAASVEQPAFRYADGFKTSGPRKKRTGKLVLQHTSSELYDSSLQELRTGNWLQECHRLTRDAVKEASIDSPSVLCLGLGCPASSRNARSQLAFLIETRDNLFLDRDKVAAYDPAFTAEDVALLAQLSSKDLSIETPTLLFMPHCDMGLYEALLRDNWSSERLCSLFLIGNLFSDYLVNKPSNKMATQFPCLTRLTPYLLARPLPSGGPNPTAFVSLAIQFVAPQALPPRTDTTFWELPSQSDVAGESNKGCFI